MAGWYELKATMDRQFMFNLKGANGEIILTSERYLTKAAAQLGIELVKQNAAYESSYARRSTVRSEPYFVLKTENGEVIGTSEAYSSAAELEHGIAAVKANGPTAPTRDLT